MLPLEATDREWQCVGIKTLELIIEGERWEGREGAREAAGVLFSERSEPALATTSPEWLRICACAFSVFSIWELRISACVLFVFSIWDLKICACTFSIFSKPLSQNVFFPAKCINPAHLRRAFFGCFHKWIERSHAFCNQIQRSQKVKKVDFELFLLYASFDCGSA